ncbi:hypothetical protein CY35_08G026900 [Sphagnum magellanicum]|nr:hypothetical protein CY35_08G026900 [Sphagnum magellanicum]
MASCCSSSSSSSSSSTTSQWVFPVIYLVLLCLLNGGGTTEAKCYSTIFGFGDSKTDTGQMQTAFPFQTAAEFWPYGKTFFGRPVNRYCDGRLVIDFMTQAYNLPFLSPYFEALNSDFRHGVNFAASSAGARRVIYRGCPFTLPIQLQQYRRFKLTTLSTDLEVRSPNATGFRTGLHVVSVGENDYRLGYHAGMTFDQVVKWVPDVVGNITAVLEGLYLEGAREFFVMNIAVEGCEPCLLALFLDSPPSDYDELGCLKGLNDVTHAHNNALKAAVDMLRLKYPDATFIYGDHFGSHLNILKNYKKHGFESVTKACCGSGPLSINYNENITCGMQGSTVCTDPSNHVSWDGVHLTEHVHRLIALDFLTGSFTDPPNALSGGCNLNLDFGRFAQGSDQLSELHLEVVPQLLRQEKDYFI